MGAEAVPVSVLRKGARYVPARTHTVSPARTLPPPPASAVDSDHGLVMLPLPLLEPLGAAYHPARVVVVDVTVSADVPLLPPTLAEAVALPAVMPVAMPVVETVATLALFEAHVTVRPVRMFPAESFAGA